MANVMEVELALEPANLAHGTASLKDLLDWIKKYKIIPLWTAEQVMHKNTNP
jgi:hypothetical protein